MLERRSVGALGVIVVGLSLSALAHRVPLPTPRPSVPAIRARPEGPGQHDVAPRAAWVPSAGALRSLRDGARLDLNRATADDLELLPGVGPALARRIVAERQRRGGFRSVDEVTRVKGIGSRTLARLQPLLRVDAGAASREAARPSDEVRE